MSEKTADQGAKLSLKLMVHKKEQRVIFAEADSDFVDTLLSIMTLPLGTIVRVLEKSPDEEILALGSLKNLYHSLMDLSENYFITYKMKNMLLNPKGSSNDLCRNLKLNIDDTEPQKYCPGSSVFLSNVKTFIVTDDFHVKPNTLGACIQLLSDFGINHASQFEEKAFDISRDQILILLKGAFLFKYPLTYMVFHNHPRFNRSLVNSSIGTLNQHSAIKEADAVSKNKIMTVKVILRKSNSNFLFAVVEEEFVDFLLGFLEIPLGTEIGKLMKGNSSLECLDNLYASISTMNVGYMKSQDVKDMLLRPRLAWNHVSQNRVFSLDVSKATGSYCSRFLSLVKAPAKFLLTGDLVLTPVSSISTITELSKLKVPFNDVVEHEVSIGYEEGVELLKASLNSSFPLIDALLKGNS